MKNICCILILTLTALAVSGENWPCFRGPSHQGISTETDLPVHWSEESNVSWKRQIPGSGWSSPIVYGDRVFVTTATQDGESYRLVCINRRSGEILWDNEVFKQETSGRKEGKNSYATSTPVTDGKRVYAVAFDGSIAAVNMNGELAWTYRDFTYYSQHGSGVSPVLYEGLLIIPFDWSSRGEDKTVGWQKPWDKSFVLALDANTGKVRWKGKRGYSRIAHVTPNILKDNGQAQLVSGAGDVVQGFDLQTGGLIWTFTSKGEGVVPSIVLGQGLVFCASGFGGPAIRAIRTGGNGNISNTHLAWELKKDVPMIPSFVYLKPRVFTVNEGGAAMCITADTGEVIWRERLDGHYSASPVYADGRLYYLSEEGQTTVVQAGPEFKVLAKNKLDGACQASIAISGQCLFIRSDRYLYCIGQP